MWEGGETFVIVAVCALTHTFLWLSHTNEVTVPVASAQAPAEERSILVYTKNDDNDLPRWICQTDKIWPHVAGHFLHCLGF